MLDATVCDIYLVDNSGNLVGRPILTTCIDAYSSLCCGYALTWEGGIYSLKKLDAKYHYRQSRIVQETWNYYK